VESRQSLLEVDLSVTINVVKTKYPRRDDYVDAIAAFDAHSQIMIEFAHENVASTEIIIHTRNIPTTIRSDNTIIRSG